MYRDYINSTACLDNKEANTTQNPDDDNVATEKTSILETNKINEKEDNSLVKSEIKPLESASTKNASTTDIPSKVRPYYKKDPTSSSSSNYGKGYHRRVTERPNSYKPEKDTKPLVVDTKQNEINSDSEYCQSAKCFKQGQEMVTFMNRSVDPCESFYDFACNGWENDQLLEYLVHVLSNGGAEYDNFVKVRIRIEENLDRLLNDKPDVQQDGSGASTGRKTYLGNGRRRNYSKSSQTLSSVDPYGSLANNGTSAMDNSTTHSLLPLVKSKQMYQTCLHPAKGANIDTLAVVLDDLNGWPLLNKRFDAQTYRWQKVFPTIINNYKDDIFVELDVAVNENSTKHLMVNAM